MKSEISLDPNIPQSPHFFTSFVPTSISILGASLVALAATLWYRHAKQKALNQLGDIILAVDRIWGINSYNVSLGEPFWFQNKKALDYSDYLKILEIIDEPKVARRTSLISLILLIKKWKEAIAKYHSYKPPIEELICKGKTNVEKLHEEVLSYPYGLGPGYVDGDRLNEAKTNMLKLIATVEDSWHKRNIARAISNYISLCYSYNSILQYYRELRSHRGNREENSRS